MRDFRSILSNAAVLAATFLAVASASADSALSAESTYTKLDLGACETLSQSEEGGSVSLKCAGLPGYPVFVSEGDLRFDVDFGVANDEFATFGAFNTIGDTVEWRVNDGVPSAAILRFRLDSGITGTDEDRGEVLLVSKVGKDGAPGCAMAAVDVKTNEQPNAVARGAAAMAARFECGTDMPVAIGADGSFATQLSGAELE